MKSLKAHLFLMSSPRFNEPQPRYDNSKRNQRSMAGGKEPMVSAVDMAKKYGDFIALHPLNVEVHAGEFFGVCVRARAYVELCDVAVRCGGAMRRCDAAGAA